jgi:hypothetical protein
MRTTHFDVKSGNVLLTRELSAKLADVGLARCGGIHSGALRRAQSLMQWALLAMLLTFSELLSFV